MPTFTWIPSYDASEGMEPTVIISKFGDGYEQRVGDGINTMLGKWNVPFANRGLTEANEILDFIKARAAVESFDWTPPYGVAGKYVCRSWTRAVDGPNVMTINATFEQVPG